jgi:glycerate-2-kinase
VRYQIVGSNRHAREAAAAEARRRGYQVELPPALLTGDARAAGEFLGRTLAESRPRHPLAVLYGGETTVSVRGMGLGGRNQELALVAAHAIAGKESVVLGATGTDGVDGNSPAAGAIVDGTTVHRIRARGIDPARALASNDSYSALAAVGDALVTGPSGTNVMDIAVTLARP